MSFRTLYWIEADTVAMQAVIRRSNLDGSNIENVTHQMGMWPKRLSVTVIDGSPVIYWTDSKFKVSKLYLQYINPAKPLICSIFEPVKFFLVSDHF